jgi:fructose-bisphosphate aldolase, class II
MHALRDLLKRSQVTRVAIGHFNISDLVLLKAVFAAASLVSVAKRKIPRQSRRS